MSDVQWTPEKTKKFWNLVSQDPSFDDLYFTKNYGKSVIRFVQRYFDLSGKRVLDYGCGPGNLLKAIADLGIECKYHGVDYSDGSISNVKKNFGKFSQFDGASVIQNLATDNLEKKFDAIICCEVIEHLADSFLKDLLSYFKRHLNDGGIVIFTTPNQENLGQNSVYCPDCGAHFHRWQHVRSWNTDSLDQFLKRDGFLNNRYFEVELSRYPLLGSVKTFLLRKVRKQIPGNLICLSRLA